MRMNASLKQYQKKRPIFVSSKKNSERIGVLAVVGNLKGERDSPVIPATEILMVNLKEMLLLRGSEK